MPKEISTRTERILVKPRHENHRACKALCSLRQAFFYGEKRFSTPEVDELFRADNPDRYKVFSTASSQRISHRSSTKIRRTSRKLWKPGGPILPFSLGSQSPKLFQISQDIHCWTKRHFGSISASYKSAVEKSWVGRLVNADINGAWNILLKEVGGEWLTPLQQG